MAIYNHEGVRNSVEEFTPSWRSNSKKSKKGITEDQEHILLLLPFPPSPRGTDREETTPGNTGPVFTGVYYLFDSKGGRCSAKTLVKTISRAERVCVVYWYLIQ